MQVNELIKNLHKIDNEIAKGFGLKKIIEKQRQFGGVGAGRGVQMVDLPQRH